MADWKDINDLINSGDVMFRRIETKVEQRFSILPDDNEPRLKVEEVTENGRVVSACSMNLAAVDDLIGRLIKMRDLMAAMKNTR